MTLIKTKTKKLTKTKTKGGKDSCSHGKDVCGTCDGTGKVDEAYEAVVEAVVEEVAEVVTNSALNDAMAELKALAGI